MVQIVSPPNSYTEVLPSSTLERDCIWDGVFEEVIKLKWGHWSGV